MERIQVQHSVTEDLMNSTRLDVGKLTEHIHTEMVMKAAKDMFSQGILDFEEEKVPLTHTIRYTVGINFMTDDDLQLLRRHLVRLREDLPHGNEHLEAIITILSSGL